jgi:hypothetical protein
VNWKTKYDLGSQTVSTMKTPMPRADCRFSRRLFLKRSGAASLGLTSLAGLQLPSSPVRATEARANEADWAHGIVDPEIRAGMEAAVFKNLIPAATERVYPGHFTINADGGGYGGDTTWPGLDSWQMVGPYLQLGRTLLQVSPQCTRRIASSRSGRGVSLSR